MNCLCSDILLTDLAMLYDRPYMRERREDYRTSPLTWLISAIVAAYVLQMLLIRPLEHVAWAQQFEQLIINGFALSVSGLHALHLWTLVSYGFLHDTDNILYVFGNLLILYFLGRELLPMLGTRRFFGLYAGALLLGGLFWTAVN